MGRPTASGRFARVGSVVVGGDEQERLRWYEGLAATAMIQRVLMPWLAVVALAVWGSPVVPAMIVVLVGGYRRRERAGDLVPDDAE